jgi:phosphate transport system substrate-binding protein
VQTVPIPIRRNITLSNKRSVLRALPVSVAAMLLLAACGNGASSSPSGAAASMDELTGDIIISGSSTVEPISSLVAEDFQAMHPDVNYSVDGPGTGDGFALFCGGETDISDASRAIKDEEEATCADNGITFVELHIATDGISVLTSTSNDIDCLSFLDLYALLGPESQGFDSWADANDLATELADDLGDEYGASNAPYPDEPLDVTAPGEESGTYDSFLELAFEDIAEARGQDAVARPDYTASADDNVIIEGISGSDASLGWVGFAFYEENTDVVKAIQVDGGDGCVEPTGDSIAAFEYPLSRPLFIYPNVDAVAENPAIEAFVDYYLSDDGLAAVDEAGYVSLPADDLDETRAAWDGR